MMGSITMMTIHNYNDELHNDFKENSLTKSDFFSVVLVFDGKYIDSQGKLRMR